MAFYGIGSRRGPRQPQYPRTTWGHPMYPQAPQRPAGGGGGAYGGGIPPLQQYTGINPYIAPTAAPPGSFDPALTAQGENADLGYEWAGQDFTLGNQQRLNDLNGDPTYGTAGTLGQIQHSYDTQLAGTNKQFANLAAGQADQAARAGVDSGGAAAQSAQKRGANWQDIVNQLNYGRDQAVASAKQGFDRANSAADTQFQRAGATNTLFHSQLNREEVYGAQQAGLLPPVKTMPKFPPNRRFVGIKGARI
jgi:hypothetical protein